MVQGGAGTGFSSEIETLDHQSIDVCHVCVAREPASHLRLKLPIGRHCICRHHSGAGTGFSSEIETVVFRDCAFYGAEVAREPASHLRLKPEKIEKPYLSLLAVAREPASHLRLKHFWFITQDLC